MSVIQIFDNFISEEEQDYVQDLFTSDKLIWHFQDSISTPHKLENNQKILVDDNIQDTSAFAFFIHTEGEKQKSEFVKFLEIIELGLKKQNVIVNKVLRCRAVFMAPFTKKPKSYNIPHVDMYTPHNTLIYYINDADGDTYFFKEKYDGTNDFTKKTLVQTVTPKKGRAVLFDGLQYHTGTNPTTNYRILINYNFL